MSAARSACARPAIRNTRRCWSRHSGPAAPVRWLASRSEGFLTDNQARDTIIEAALALGRRRAVSRARHRRARQYGRLPDLARGLYRDREFRALPARHVRHRADRAMRIRCLFTNTVPTGPYRGAGRPEANYMLERLVDAAARVSRHRPARIAAAQPDPAGPDAIQDAGRHELRQRRFPGAVRDRAGTRRCRAFQARGPKPPQRAGRRRGLGVACFLEIAGGQPGEGASLAFPGGSRLLLAIGVQASGQGHRTLYRRLAAERLGIPVEQLDFEQGDSDDGVPSAGAVASRSTMSVGGALVAAIDAVIEKGRRVAAHLLEAAEADIVYRNGVFEIAGTDRRIGLFDLAAQARALAADGHNPRGSRHAPHRRRAADLPERCPCRRGRDRSGHRRCEVGALHRGR